LNHFGRPPKLLRHQATHATLKLGRHMEANVS